MLFTKSVLTNFEEVIAKNRFSSFSTFSNFCPCSRDSSPCYSRTKIQYCSQSFTRLQSYWAAIKLLCVTKIFCPSNSALTISILTKYKIGHVDYTTETMMMNIVHNDKYKQPKKQ